MDVQADLSRGTGVIVLPPGETHITKPLEIPKGSRKLTLQGDPRGSTLVMDTGFQGSAAIVLREAEDVTLNSFIIRGNRKSLDSDWYLPLNEAPFADYYSDNGIVVRKSAGVTIRDMVFREIRAFPVLVNASRNLQVDGVTIEDCGTLNRAGRNNTTGGILLEEGVEGFDVRYSTIRRITGNAIWTHSYSRSPRQADGRIRNNTIEGVGRDAIQVGHATRISVTGNEGRDLGFPAEWVDVENHGVAVALDTAGNVDHAVYAGNSFVDVNGQCIDLDGFHDGEVTSNSCMNTKALESYPALHFGVVFGNNDPGMEATGITVSRNRLDGFAYGAVFLIGRGNRVENNVFTRVNLAHCGSTPLSARCNYAVAEQPDLLRTGIYLAANGGRASVNRNNIIRGNVIEGFGMSEHCIAAGPGVELSSNTVEGNRCASPRAATETTDLKR
jgi:hypothetical protein